MIKKLTINNFALIEKLSINFDEGLNTITGETGAGKSIILGALSLILGQRADLSSLRDKSQECIVEGVFSIKNYPLQSFFDDNDLDYDAETYLRREITPSGRSRAFINDTPVSLKVMRTLGLQLIDIHSQHRNLELSNNQYQLNLIDTVANNSQLLLDYQNKYKTYQTTKKELDKLITKAKESAEDLDYFQFQFNQLENANLQVEEQERLEEELEKLNHAEEIKVSLKNVINTIDNENLSVLSMVKEAEKNLNNISGYFSQAEEWRSRIESVRIELGDLQEEIENISLSIEHNPERIEQINDRLSEIFSLQQKHNVNSVEELLKIKEDLDSRLLQISNYDDDIETSKIELHHTENELNKLANDLSIKRRKSFKSIEKAISSDLKKLGMKRATIRVEQHHLDSLTPTGIDQISILFSANIDVPPSEIVNIASGGEVSRLMIAIKNLLRKTKVLPTIIFDEIDTGVSGEVAIKMGEVINSFAESTQIVNITHLPQVAAQGDAHFVVKKSEENKKTTVTVNKLDHQERIEELAKMIGGTSYSQTALETAKELLNT